MTEFLQSLLRTEGFHPHGYCYLWKPGLIWLHVTADVLIGLAYVAIGFGLAHFVRKARGELPFSGMFVAFGIFIAACGATHFVEVWTLWTPVYWFAGGVKVVTAAASVFTAIALPPLIPVALKTITEARVSESRRTDLEAAHERLRELDELKTQFFASVSHELRTPLSLIIGPVDRLLTSEDLAEDHRQQLQTVRRNANMLLKHVNDLLEVARLQAGRMALVYRRTDLSALVRRVTGHFETVVETQGVGFRVDAPDPVPAEIDPDKVERILFNLLGNAIQFTPTGGEIRCEVRLDEPAAGTPDRRGRAVVTIHDSGPGVPPEFRRSIFEPFRQMDGKLERRHEGTGLGLAIVADLVKLHEGSVHVEDSPLGGAAFVVELPLAAPVGVVVDAPEPEEAPDADDLERIEVASLRVEAAPPEAGDAASDVPEGDAPLVLVVEDNVEMNRLVSEILAGEYRVARAYDGASGIRKALELRPDLIVSDVMMPEVGGEALVREVRGHPELDATPIILLSALADEAARVKLLTEGAQDFITKPFAADELRARVGNWVGIRRAREILQRALDSTVNDVQGLAREIATRNADLSNALDAARLAVEEAETANRAKSDFLNVMSHELRTPLNAVLGYAELMEAEVDGELSEKHRRYVERMKRSAVHLRDMVDEVLTFERMEGGRETVSYESMDLRQVVEEAVGFLEPDAAARGLTLRMDLPPEPLEVRSDPPKVRQILLNLLGNAVKFTDEGEVSVSLEAASNQAVVRVRDTGIGIDPKHLDRVFDPFWQVDASSTRTAGGTGLGLTITRRLVELLGGTIQVESRPGEGSTFTVRLPVDGSAGAV
jgi:signal transduction histidine kinase